LVEDIAKVAGEKIDEIAFIIGDFGPEVEASLIRLLKNWAQKEAFTHKMNHSELHMRLNAQKTQCRAMLW